VISSREKAPKHGGGRLLVDGGDDTLHRKAEFSFNPSNKQMTLLLMLLRACCEVYNAALEERSRAWKRSRTSVRAFDQFNQITHLRGCRDDVLRWGITPLRGTLRRLDAAYASFYRRCKNGQTPGHPRFKSHTRFDTVGWDETTGWKIDTTAGTMYLQGVGTIKLPKSAIIQMRRFENRGGQTTTLTVTRVRSGSGWKWRECVGFKNVATTKTVPAAGADSLVGLDRGVVVTVAGSDGTLVSMPAFLAEAREEISDLLRQRTGKKVGSRSWQQLNRKVAKAYRRAKQRSDNWARETAIAIVAEHGVIVLEDLKLKNMTRSARGTMEAPGKNVAQKQGLNRALHDAALGRLHHWILVKAEEAGRISWVVPAANTSRTCAACGHCHVTNRKSRDVFECRSCGHTAHADTNAAENVAARGQACHTSWLHVGAPPLERAAPRLRRRKAASAQHKQLLAA
jgi:putative transposase